MKKPADKTLEQALIKKSQKGNTDAFDQLVALNKEKMDRFSISACNGDEELADEIFQQATIKAWKNIVKFNMDSSFATWFYRIARNLFFDHKRATSRRKFYSFQHGSQQPHVLAEGVGSYVESYDGSSRKLFGYGIEDSKAVNSSTVPDTPADALKKKDSFNIAEQLSSNILSKLSEDHRAVLRMREFEELAYADIAKKLKISEGTVMSRLFYARKNAQKIAEREKKKV